jgi:uncharacterized protein YndB with AHSA1/START domain
MAELKHLVEINAPASKVYRALTEQEGLAGWWTLETVAEPKVGGILELTFGDKYYDKMRVTGLEPNRRVEWECIQGHEEWVGTTFVFDLEEKDGTTALRFTQGNWRAATDFFALCNTTWGYYMQSIKEYCETGTGKPFRRGV